MYCYRKIYLPIYLSVMIAKNPDCRKNFKVDRALNIINNYASILKQFMKHEGYKWWSVPIICSGGSYVNLVKLGILSVEPGGRRCRQRSPRQLINHNTLVNWHHSPGFLVPSSYPFCKIWNYLNFKCNQYDQCHL